jgi:hypothetical protein
MLAATKSSFLRSAAIAAVIAAAALILPAAAPAATVSVSEELPEYDHLSQLLFVAAPGESNDVSVALLEERDAYLTVEIRDAGTPVAAGQGCSGGGEPGRPVVCRLHELVAHELCLKFCPVPQYGENWRVSMAFELEDGENSLHASEFLPKEPIPISVTSGSGDDRIETAAADDSVEPGGGTDTVSTGLGNDRIEATALPDGPDRYDLGENPHGNSDRDLLSYAERLTPVEAQAGRGGAVGEEDEMIGVERLIGGSGDDHLVGGGGIRRIEGRAGADVIIGGQEESKIYGGSGDDLLIGGSQRDEIRETEKAGSGNDTARGAGGRDLIVLGTGIDRAFAGRGDDVIQGGPGHDSLGCGPGDGDTVIEPTGDALRHCEWVIPHYY